MANVIYNEDQMIVNDLGHQVGDTYQIHDQTSKVLDNINRRLNEENKNLRNYRRALSFSQIFQKDLVPILLNAGDDMEVFDAVIRLLVNLTVPIECLCSVDYLQTDQGRQTKFELTSSLMGTKESFRDPRTTNIIMYWVERLIGQEKMSNIEVNLVNNCLLLVRNILHIPEISNINKTLSSNCSIHNQILWNLFAKNLDKILLDLIQHHISSIWCTSVVQLIALVYKDQHVITLQKLLQNFLESSLSESSEDNESNTSPHFQIESGSCTPSTYDSSDQNSRETSTPELLSSSNTNSPTAQRRNSCGSLEVLPNNSPAPSDEMEDCQVSDFPTIFKDQSKVSEPGGLTSGHESEILSGDCELGPPSKLYISEGKDGERIFHPVSPQQKAECEFVHKIRSPKHNPQIFRSSGPVEKGGSGTDSSDISGVPKSSKLPAKHGSITDSTDYGYVTRESRDQEQENQERNSSSSNDDDLGNRNPRTNPVKPRAKDDCPKLSPSEKKEKQRLRLLKRSKANRMRVKAMVNHTPTDNDISELLKEFTVDFLHNGYSSLVEKMLEKLSGTDTERSTEKSHFLWLLTYFLKFASQLEIGVDQIGKVMSFATLSYVTYEGVDLLETLELAHREQKDDLGPHLRRIHLVVTALREFFQTVASYNEIKHLSLSEKKHIENLRLQTLYARDCRQLLVLLLRRFNPQSQTLQYLCDTVVCNHMLLLDLELVSDSENLKGLKFNMRSHVKQFANAEMMRHFGRLLEEYEKNTPFVNDCIFTVMHHIAGDLDSPQTLYIPSILKSFSRIWEQGLQICEDWVDLIEFIIQKFIQNMGSSPQNCAVNMVEYLDFNEEDERGFTSEQARQLFLHFAQVENSKDPVGAIIDVYRQTDNISFPRLRVIEALLSHGIITYAQYMNFMYMKNVMSQCKNQSQQGSVKAEVGSEHCISEGHNTDNDEPLEDKNSGPPDKNKDSEIQVLKDCLVRQGKESLIPWLQHVLLDACRVKMFPHTLVPEGSVYPHEPIPYYYNKAKQSIPLVPWNRIQYLGLQTEAFILLLHKLGFHLPADLGKVYPRIPHFWSADHIYTVAAKIGTIDKDTLKFTLEDLETISKRNNETNSKKDHDMVTIDEMEMVGSGFESMDLDLLNVSPSNQTKPNTEVGAWLNFANASKDPNDEGANCASATEAKMDVE